MNMSLLSNTALPLLIQNLPRYSEEDDLFTIVKRTELQQKLVAETELSNQAAELLIVMIERLLNSVATLDETLLLQGEWKFVSFSAQLFALSLLQTLADDQHRWLEPYYWKQPEHENTLNKQQQLLHTLEIHRVRNHRQQAAAPIRFIYVAWILIRLEGQFWLHRREDSTIRDGQGEYVLIGGRMNARDFKGVLTEADKLRLLQEPSKELLDSILANTLKREIEEETGLHQQQYQVKPLHWGKLKTYCQVAGAKANHAYTEYHINIFECHQLTLSGLFQLLQVEQQRSEYFKRFSLDEIVSGRTTDGKTAYLDALYAHFNDNQKELKTTLTEIPDAFSNDYCSDTITIPLDSEQSIQKGITGKEQALNIHLDNTQCALLWALAAHAKGFELIPINEQVKLLGYEWLCVTDNSLSQQIQGLAETLRDQSLPLIDIEPFEQKHYFRLKVEPEKLFLDDRAFCYQFQPLSENWWTLVLETKTIQTPLGNVTHRRKTVKISSPLKTRLERLSCDDISLYDAVRIGIEPRLNLTELGLRKFLRLEQQNYRICCQLSESELSEF
jgi:8-oxo-dGTP pyrophosphatase MutT (NUDIX family)